MENLLASRTLRDQEPYKLQNLSPQKYGKAAYANLSYTPSKLVDNVLYKEITTQKKMQQGTSKLRQTQAMNSLFQDRLAQLQEERDGIQKTLTDQIAMYKKMLKDTQQKNQKRIKNLQQGFNQQMQRLLDQKQQQAKFAQSQRQLLQNRICELEQALAQVRDQLANVDGNYLNLKNQNQKLKIIQDSLQKRLQQAQNTIRKNQQKAKADIQQLRRQLYNTELDWQNKLQKQIHAKNKEIENLQRLHRNELQKIENKRIQQAMIKNQQLKDLAATFEKQTSRLNGIINKKEQLIDQLNKAIDLEKQKAYNMSKGYENQITNLSHEKSRLKQQLLKADRRIQKLMGEVKDLQERLSTSSSTLTAEIAQLKKDLELNQINLMRQIDNRTYSCEQYERQIARLQVQNTAAAGLAGQNTSLHRQLRNMKQLLMESSLQMQRCKQQFIRLGRQKDLLIVKLRQIGIENQTLYRIKNERQEEARGWRESYFIQKNQY